MHQTEIIHFLRNRKNRRVGVLIGMKNQDSITVGWSLCNKKDQFNKDMALHIARERAMFGIGKSVNTPHLVNKQIDFFIDRCERYFKSTVNI